MPTEEQGKEYIAPTVSFEDAMQFFKLRATTIKPSFVVDENNEKVISSMIRYFSDYLDCDISPNKGILLMGTVGTGKTTIFEVFKSIINESKKPYDIKVINVYGLYQDVRDERHKILDVLDRIKGTGSGGYRIYGGANIHEYVLDDLGMDPIVKAYGNEVDLSGEIIYQRYGLFINDRIKTHATTNLSVTEIKARLGERVYDRMKEMFNILILSGESRRK